MFSWELFELKNENENWDHFVEKCDGYNIYQSMGWGEYKEKTGWKKYRYVAKNKNQDVVCMVQFLCKAFPFGIKLFWAPGGPIFAFSNFNKKHMPTILSNLFDFMKIHFGKKILIRFNLNCSNQADLSLVMNQIMFRPYFKINSGYSMSLNISESLENLKKDMTAKHRYYLKKALNNKIKWEYNNDKESINNFLCLYNEMANSKTVGLTQYNKEDLMDLVECLKSNVVVLSGFSEDGDEPIASCIVFLFRKTAFYSMAATGNTGRKLNVSYSMIYRLWEILKDKNIEKFDFGGIGFDDKSAGVNHFKKGFGGELIEYLGEWEWSQSALLRIVLNLAIKFKLSNN